jgi:hypothetical protein
MRILLGIKKTCLESEGLQLPALGLLQDNDFSFVKVALLSLKIPFICCCVSKFKQVLTFIGFTILRKMPKQLFILLLHQGKSKSKKPHMGLL